MAGGFGGDSAVSEGGFGWVGALTVLSEFFGPVGDPDFDGGGSSLEEANVLGEGGELVGCEVGGWDVEELLAEVVDGVPALWLPGRRISCSHAVSFLG